MGLHVNMTAHVYCVIYYASVVYAVVTCLSFCPPQISVQL